MGGGWERGRVRVQVRGWVGDGDGCLGTGQELVRGQVEATGP